MAATLPAMSAHFYPVNLQPQYFYIGIIVDAGGNTNTISGLVEQNGTIWVQNLPLAAGANQLTLTVANASGSSTTNLTVYQSSVLVTVAPLTSDQLNQTSITVAGTISELGDTVTVNGVPATVNPDGTWEADGVPVSAYGTAIIDVEVYAGNTSNFAHNNLRFTPLDSPSNGNSIGSHISNQLQPVAVKMASYFTHKSYAIMVVSIVPDFTVYQTVQVPVWWQGGIGIKFYSDDDTVNWAAGVGGTKHDYGYSDDNPGNFDGWQEFGPDQGGVGSAPGWSGWESADDSGTYSGDSTGTWSKTVRTRVVIAPAGQQAAGQTNSYLVLASALEVADGWDSGNGVIPLPPEWLQINGQTLINSGITNADGSVSGAAIVQAPAGTTTNVTPVATQLYGYNDILFNNQVFQLISQCVATTPGSQARTNLGVGEQVNLYFNPALPTNATWTTTAGGLSVTSGTTNLFTAPSNAANVTVTATVGSLPINFCFKVFEPSGYDHSQTIGTNHYPVGVAGVGMTNIIWIAPTNVSFSRVSIMEVGEDASNIYGYFTQWTPQQLRHNTADVWTQLNVANQFQDWASHSFYPSPWSAGSFMWDIPAKWRVTGSNVTNSMNGWNQTVSIDASGTMTVQKFGHSATRTINDVINTN